MRRSLASDADEGAALFASVADIGLAPSISGTDAGEIDEPSASLAVNGVKPMKALFLLLISETETPLELVVGGELLPLCPEGFPNKVEQFDATGIRDLVDGGILFTA